MFYFNSFCLTENHIRTNCHVSHVTRHSGLAFCALCDHVFAFLRSCSVPLLSIHTYSTVCWMASSSSLLRSIPISFPSSKQWTLKSTRRSLRASATPTQKARFVARRKESVSVRQLQRPLSNVRQMLINQFAFNYSLYLFQYLHSSTLETKLD